MPLRRFADRGAYRAEVSVVCARFVVRTRLWARVDNLAHATLVSAAMVGLGR